MRRSAPRPGGRGGKRILCGIGILLLCLILPGFFSGLTVRHYALDAGFGQEHKPIRLALITDLHSCSYGRDMEKLIGAVKKQAPDVILLGGDIFDDGQPDDNAERFLAGIAGYAPSYYVTGNHEYWSGENAFAEKMAILDRYGVVRLRGTGSEIGIGGIRLTIGGVDDPCAWTGDLSETVPEGFRAELAAVSALCEEADYAILLTHRPELFDLYVREGFDLVLAGHAHGGQWRIPGLLNGLYAPNQGFFPPLAGGKFEKDGTVMIVSRGLARESTRIPRFYNPPELVIIDLQ